MHRFLSIVWWLSVCSVCSVGTLRSQPANVQADPTTGVLFRPSAATFISGNNLASATGGIVLGANGGTGVANTGKTITLGGNVTTSGAFGLTLTLTAATGVTLPTTGTLATLAGSETLTNKTLTSPTLTTPTLGTATATSLTLSGNISSSAWTTSGVRLKGVAATLTDTTSTGTVAAAYTDVLGGNTIAASSATTYTDYITAFFKEPTAGSLVTMTNKWALGGESLRIGTSTPMSVSPAGAITANSLTGRTTTDLTLAGGSTGASLVLGQGANANATITPTGTGGVTLQSSANNGDVLLRLRGTNASPNGTIRWTTSTDTYTVGIGSRFNVADSGLEFLIGSSTTGMNLRSTGNLLIGTTTDAASLAGGLVVNGSGAGAAASSTTTGALRVTGGVGVSGAGYFGGLLNVAGSATFAGAVTVNAISGINALAAGTQLATFESSVNGAAVELITKGKNSTGTARQANIGINRFADDVLSFSNGTTELLRLHLTTQAAAFAGAVTAGAVTASGIGTIGGVFNGAGSGSTNNVSIGTSGGGALFLQGYNAAFNAGQTLGINTVAGGAVNVGNSATITTINGTTPSTGAGSGALQVAGGIYSGAASVFGSTLTVTGNNAGIITQARIANAAGSDNSGVKIAFDSGGTDVAGIQQKRTASGTHSLTFQTYSFGNVDALTLAGTGAATFAGAVITSSATLSGAGAIPITTSLVKFTSTGAANALTLANGVDGQRLTIVHDVDGGSGVLTPTTKTGFSTVTFTNAGDTVSLVYVTTRGWMVTGSYLATIAP